MTYNAVTELMTHAKKPKPAPTDSAPTDTMNTVKRAAKKAWDRRDGLIAYIEQPEKNPEGKVVEYDDDFVVINDKYSKARYAHTLSTLPYGVHPKLRYPASTSYSSRATQQSTTNTRSSSSPPTRNSSRKYAPASSA